MSNKAERILQYTDKWGGKNYGCYAISTPGHDLKQRLDKSSMWRLAEVKERIDPRNDNQVDIHRGSNLVYLYEDGIKRIDVVMNKSRSGKTVEWIFRFNFDEPVNCK